MAEHQNILLIEGSFRELAEELADYVDNLQKSQLRAELDPLLAAVTAAEEASGGGDGDEGKADAARDAVLRPLVRESGALTSAPEKEFVAAHNLLIHLINQSPNVNEYLQPICKNLASAEFAGPPSNNRPGLALSVLSTVFNVLEPDDTVRFPVFNAILDVLGRIASYESIRPQLKNLDHWIAQWEAPPGQQRRLYMRISALAKDAGEAEEAYVYHIKALRTVTTAEVGSDEAKQLSIGALKLALGSPAHFDFEDITSLDSVQHLRGSAPAYFQLLEIFTSDSLEDYVGFKEEHKGFIEAEGLDDGALTRKMRLLTLASLGASSGQQRSLPYASIAEALQIPTEDVEMWVIDVIRAGLVEGKLSQLNQTFLIHRSTYRVFSENQWREVAGRLDMWKTSLTNVLEVIRQEKESMLQQKEMELKAAESKMNGFSGYSRRGQQRGGGGGGGGGGGDAIDLGMD